MRRKIANGRAVSPESVANQQASALPRPYIVVNVAVVVVTAPTPAAQVRYYVKA